MVATRLERIAMVGAGLTGTYLALDWARAGHPVTIYDVDHERARTAPERTREIGAELVRGGVTDQTALDEALTRLASTPDLQAAVGQADYVAEAIVEDLAGQVGALRRAGHALLGADGAGDAERGGQSRPNSA